MAQHESGLRAFGPRAFDPRFDADWLVPDWQAPGVGALMTTRAGGAGSGAFASLNLREGLGDDDATVAANQRRVQDAIGAEPVWLTQVHGTRVVRIGAADAALPIEGRHVADASMTTAAGVACAVQVADCLPVLFAAPQARGVAAAHAGWRGLAGGVLEASVAALCDAAGCAPGELQAWLGPCIGPRQFEVGRDVLDAFGAAGASEADAGVFIPGAAPGKWIANLPELARRRLQAAGVRSIGGGAWCTVEAPSRFFSYRRDRLTGRMAALVWIERG